MGWPDGAAMFRELALGGAQGARKIQRVQLLGHKGDLKWTQDANGLKVQMPPQKPCDHAIALRIEGA